MERTVTYFERPGPDNTDAVIELVRQRAQELSISHLVVASDTGDTGVRFLKSLSDTPISLVVVASVPGFKGGDDVALLSEHRECLEAGGAHVVLHSHILSGVGRAITSKFGGVTGVELIAHTLRLFSQGVKVAVEVAVMAGDAGRLPTGQDAICVGGSGRGADSALVLRPAHAANFFDLRIRELICMPR